jgi:hypothetical protein
LKRTIAAKTNSWTMMHLANDDAGNNDPHLFGSTGTGPGRHTTQETCKIPTTRWTHCSRNLKVPTSLERWGLSGKSGFEVSIDPSPYHHDQNYPTDVLAIENVMRCGQTLKPLRGNLSWVIVRNAAARLALQGRRHGICLRGRVKQFLDRAVNGNTSESTTFVDRRSSNPVRTS